MSTDLGLERRLRDLATAIDLPVTDDLSTRVIARLDRRAVTRRRAWALPLPRWAAATAAVVVVTAAVLILSPGARQAVADLFRVVGVEVRVGEVDAPIAADLRLGDPVTIDDAAVRAGFDLVVPRQLGEPAAVYVDDDPRGDMVWFVYPPGDALPRTRETGVGALFSQFPADLGADRVEKVVAPEGSDVAVVVVNGQLAIWIEGQAHAFTVIAPDGSDRQIALRLAGNTLLWQHGDLTLRLESALDLEAAVAIAESVAP